MSGKDKKAGLVLLGLAGACVGLVAYRRAQTTAEDEELLARRAREDEEMDDVGGRGPSRLQQAPAALVARIHGKESAFFQREMTPAEFAAFEASPRLPIVLASGRDPQGRKHYLLGDWTTGGYAYAVDEGDGRDARREPYSDAPRFIQVL